jgi:hypothetical protein
MKTVLAGLALSIFLALRPAAGQPDTAGSVKEGPVKILIAKGNTYLENTVAALISDSMQECAVTTIPLEDLAKQNRSDYKIVLLFNAIKRDQINSTINKYIKTTENYGTRSNLLICTPYGEVWKGKESALDAVTTATKTLSPGNVASKVVANIRRFLQKKQ